MKKKSWMERLERIRFIHIFNRLSDSASFKTRLFLTFILVAVPILAIMCIGSFVVLRHSTRESIQRAQTTELEKINTQIHTIVSDTENMSREIIYNVDVQKMLTESYHGEQYPADTSVAYYINGFVANRDFVDCVVLTGIDHTLFSTERAYTNVSAFQNICKKWWYPDLRSLANPYSWYSSAQLTASQYQKLDHEKKLPANSLMLARPIYSMEDYQTLLGYMMIYLREDYFQDIWDQLNWGNTTNIYLLDKNNTLLAANVTPDSRTNYSKILEDIPVQTGNQIRIWHGDKYVLSCSDVTLNKWKICMVTPYTEVNSSEVILQLELFAMVGSIVLILFLMSNLSASNMARPIIYLSRIMDSYHGKDEEPDEKNLELYKNRTDEIGQMYRSYEQLQDRLNTLIKEIYIRNLEKKDAELALLQSQINPHFLYNTLDSINWLALANDQDEISEMITALSDTFRLSLMKNNSSFVAISDEIQYIKSYLMLQKFRYGDRLNYKFEIPDELPKLYVPRFILQPVIENSLKHGIDQIEGGGLIQIRFEISSQLRITVTNDGNQIDLDKMRQLLFFDPKSTDILAFQKGGYGVQNIHRRIKFICGDSFGLSYSKTDTQTICQILLPLKTEEQIGK